MFKNIVVFSKTSLLTPKLRNLSCLTYVKKKNTVYATILFPEEIEVDIFVFLTLKLFTAKRNNLAGLKLHKYFNW